MFSEDIKRLMVEHIGESISYEITMLENKGVIIEGQRGIRRCEEDEIIVKVRKYYIVIKGKSLAIKEINDADIFIMGTVDSVGIENE